MMPAPRCLLVEDEPVLADLIRDNLTRDGFAVEHAADGATALSLLADQTFVLLILDVMLPRIDGFDVLRAIRARGDRTPVLILSAKSAESDRITGLELEADDYLTKPFSLRELLLRCQALVRRTLPGSNGRSVCTFGGNTIDLRARRARTWRGDDVDLTPGEVALLQVLAERPGEVITRRELIDTVFGPSTPVKHRTLDNLVLRLRRLFEPTDQPVHLHTIRGVGLRLDLDR